MSRYGEKTKKAGVVAVHEIQVGNSLESYGERKGDG